MKLLIIGDSFAADWSVKYPDVFGWPNLLANSYDVTNLAQAGASEYKILQQIKSADLDHFDIIILVHTSPYRVPTRKHPVHSNDCLHKHADLLLADIQYHATWYRRLYNRALSSAYGFFLHHFDVEYQETIYELLVEKINQTLKHKKVITVKSPLCPLIIDDAVDIQEFDAGKTNHMSINANIDFYKKLLIKINAISKS